MQYQGQMEMYVNIITIILKETKKSVRAHVQNNQLSQWDSMDYNSVGNQCSIF